MWDEEDDGGDDGEIAIRPDPAIVEVGKVLVKVIFDDEAHGSCNSSEHRVPTKHQGNFEVPVFVQTPKVREFSWRGYKKTVILSSLSVHHLCPRRRMCQRDSEPICKPRFLQGT